MGKGQHQLLPFSPTLLCLFSMDFSVLLVYPRAGYGKRGADLPQHPPPPQHWTLRMNRKANLPFHAVLLGKGDFSHMYRGLLARFLFLFF